MVLATMLLSLLLFTCLLFILMVLWSQNQCEVRNTEKKYEAKKGDSGSFVSYVDLGGIKPLSMPSRLDF